MGALIIRIGFWGPLYYNHNKEPPPNSIGNYSAFRAVQGLSHVRLSNEAKQAFHDVFDEHTKAHEKAHLVLTWPGPSTTPRRRPSFCGIALWFTSASKRDWDQHLTLGRASLSWRRCTLASFCLTIWEFPKIRRTLFWGPSYKDPII